MEAVAYGDQTMRFDRLLRVGECYDFMRVGFSPTHVGPLGYATSSVYVRLLCGSISIKYG